MDSIFVPKSKEEIVKDLSKLNKDILDRMLLDVSDKKNDVVYENIKNIVLKIKLLINAGADVDTENTDGLTPLMNFSREGITEAVEYLIKNKADVNKTTHKSTRHTPLMYAAARGKLEVVKVLLEHGANANAINVEGYTPLKYAIEAQHYDSKKFISIQNLLKKYGATGGINKYC